MKTAEAAGCPDYPREQGVCGVCPARCGQPGAEGCVFHFDCMTMKRWEDAAPRADEMNLVPAIVGHRRRILPADEDRGVGMFPNADGLPSYRGSVKLVGWVEENAKSVATKEDPHPCNQFEAAGAGAAERAKKDRPFDDKMMAGLCCECVPTAS